MSIELKRVKDDPNSEYSCKGCYYDVNMDTYNGCSLDPRIAENPDNDCEFGFIWVIEEGKK